MKRVWISGDFDDLRSRDARFLEEASKLGELHVLLWSDGTILSIKGQKPHFPQEERVYLIDAIRFVTGWQLSGDDLDPDTLPELDKLKPDIWVVGEREDNQQRKAFCETHGISYQVQSEDTLSDFPVRGAEIPEGIGAERKVVVTGCFDWFHSGHVRFFEEVSELGNLYVVVGHDANLRLLKGENHPMHPEDERLYMVRSVRHVHDAMLSTGKGWLDAEPEIAQIKPDLYVVNEDGDRPEKREYCEKHGIEYVVLERVPKEGLPRRDSTSMRGF